jgi:hypothetical protein
LSFDELKPYLKHLDFHRANTSLQVKCNLCGFNSKTWDWFKRHCKKEHQKTEFLGDIFSRETENLTIEHATEPLSTTPSSFSDENKRKKNLKMTP